MQLLLERIKSRIKYSLSIVFLVDIFFIQFSHAKELISGVHVNQYKVIRDIEWAKPKGYSLTMDIYIPQTGKSNYPVLIIYHGGGWLINNKSIMDSMSIYIAQHSEIIVCNVNYRLLGDNENTTTINEIIEDALGSFLWVKENISVYKGDPSRIAVTGDSAGGQLAAMVILGGDKLGSGGFKGKFPGYNPTFLPEGLIAEDVVRKKILAAQAAVLSYPAIDVYDKCLKGEETQLNFFWNLAKKNPRGFFGDSINVQNNAELYKAVSPIYNIPTLDQRKLPPQLCIVGSKDKANTPVTIQNYVAKLKDAGQPVEYWEYEGKPHAFLDTKPNQYLGTVFYRDAPPAIDRIIEFLNRVFKL